MRNRILSLVVAFLLVFGSSGLGFGRTPEVLAAGEATMEITPSAGIYSTARDFSLDIMLHTGLSAINAARAEIVYDPAQLTLVTIDGSSSVLTLGAPTDYSTTPDGKSQVDINRAIIGQYAGDGLMARVTFHALVAGMIPVTLVMTKPGTIPVEGSVMLSAVGSSNVLTATTSGSYILASPGVTLSPSTVAVAEGGAGSSYTVALTAPPAAAVTVGVTPDAQVTASPTTLVFTSANWSVAQTVAVTGVDDAVAEGAHAGTLTHIVTSTDSSYNGIAVSSVTASITDNDYTLTYSADANGTIIGTSPQTVNYGASGTQVTASPSTGYHFVQWSDGVLTAARTDTNVTADISVTAAFAIDTYALSTGQVGNGTVSKNPSEASYDYGTVVQLTATPDTGWHFAGWSGDVPAGHESDNPLSLTMDANKTLTATFAQNACTIVASAGPNGTISPAGNVSVGLGASQSFTITPDTGYHVLDVLVDGGSVGAVTSYDFTNVTANHTISAASAINTYTLTYTAGANGTISGTSPQTVDYGASGTSVTAVADPGYEFAQWSDGSTANPRTDTNVTKDTSVTASFVMERATVSFGPSLTPGLVLNAGQTLSVPLLLAGDLEHAAYLDLYLEWYSLTGQGYSKITTVQVSPLSASQTYAWHIPADAVADTAYLTASVWRNDGTNGGAGSYSVVRSGVMIVTPSGSVAAAVASPVAGATLTGPTVPVTVHLGNLANPWGNILEIWFSPSGAPGSFVKVYHTATGFASTMSTTVDLSFLGSGTWTACHFAVTVYVGGTTWRTNYSPTFTLTNT